MSCVSKESNTSNVANESLSNHCEHEAADNKGRSDDGQKCNDESDDDEVEEDSFVWMQKDRKHHHPNFSRPNEYASAPVETTMVSPTDCSTEESSNSLSSSPEMAAFTFVVAADTQFGILSESNSSGDVDDWQTEIRYSERAVEAINTLHPRPLFCCICGDLGNMTSSIYAGRAVKTTKTKKMKVWSNRECDNIQRRQYLDFKRVWAKLHSDIALVCVCGNHDVGNEPTRKSIRKFQRHFGDDYFSFWPTSQCFCIALNSSVFHDTNGTSSVLDHATTNVSSEIAEEQLTWLKQQFDIVATSVTPPKQIFVFLHHPLYLYDENEDPKLMSGYSAIPGLPTTEESAKQISDGYFPLPIHYRSVLLQLFQKHNVTAVFAGHFHQNMVSQTSFGMHMITTGSLSLVLQSNGAAQYHNEPKTIGYRVVTALLPRDDTTKDATDIQKKNQLTFRHEFLPLQL